MSKKIITLLLLAVILTGCGSTEKPALAESNNTSSVETSTEIASERDSISESDNPQKKYTDKELQQIKLVINYNPDGTYSKASFFISDDNDATYFSSDLTGNTDQSCGMEAFDENGRFENIFTGTLAERTDVIFNNLYESLVISQSDVINDAFMRLAKQSADEMIDPGVPSTGILPGIDMTENMPHTLSLVIDDATYEIDIIKIEMDGESLANETNKPKNTTIPVWTDNRDRCRYLNNIMLFISVPKEQLSPLYDFYASAYEELKQTMSESDNQSGGSDTISEQNLFVDPTSALIGTWYDPTGYSTAVFTFNDDGTGLMDWGNSTDNFNYSVDGNTISCPLEYHTITLTITSSNTLDYGGSKYKRKE